MSIDAMKQALAALNDYEPNEAHKVATALRAAIEQAQEPVAWMYHGIRHDDTPHERPSLIWKPDQMDVMSFEKGAKATPLYTAPPQRKPLTDEEIEVLAKKHNGIYYDCDITFARAIEAAHGIKGEA